MPGITCEDEDEVSVSGEDAAFSLSKWMVSDGLFIASKLLKLFQITWKEWVEEELRTDI